MLFCNKCGKKLPEGAKFCLECGAKVEDNDSSTQRNAAFEGKLHKCPNCGEVLKSFVLNCPTCGYEIRNSENTSAVKFLQIELNKIEESRPQTGVKNILSQMLNIGQISNTDEQKIALIRNFVIPNTKEDILEFIILASSNIDTKVYGLDTSRRGFDVVPRELSDAWLAKLEQAYQKAQLTFGGTQEFLNIQYLYQRKQKEIRRKKRQVLLLAAGLFGLSLLITLTWLLVFLTGSI